jgi:predicted Zn-dependent protease
MQEEGMRVSSCCFVAFLLLAPGCGSVTEPGAVGVDRPQFLLVSSDEVDKVAEQSYRQVLDEAQKKGALDRDPAQVQRIRMLVSRLIPQTSAFRDDAPGWAWEAHLLTSKEVNAWCMPGGKIAVYTGLIEQVRPTDDELAAVMGHEIAHALREHSRERLSWAMAQQLGLNLVGTVANVPKTALDLAPVLLDVTVNLPYSRTQEREADRVGVELAARAGYDPHAAVALWQKMEKLGGPQPPKLLATHPSPQDRMRDLQAYAEKVMPLYVAARSGAGVGASKQ